MVDRPGDQPSLNDQLLMLGATVLTAFNDNAAITYLAAQVHDLAPSAKYAVVAGAVTGGGLTVIANAPNPAGQSILSKFFKDGISPLGLLLGALVPTIIVYLCFMHAAERHGQGASRWIDRRGRARYGNRTTTTRLDPCSQDSSKPSAPSSRWNPRANRRG